MPREREVIQPVSKNNYRFLKYCSDGFGSYWWQCKEVLQNENVESVLVVGQGDNIVPYILKSQGINVDTFDIIEDMQPTYVGDIRKFESIVNKQYDCVLCCEVLEHLPFIEFEKVISQIKKKAKKKVIISLPILGIGGFIKIKLPKINITVPIVTKFLGQKLMCKEHYWEIGLKDVSLENIREIMKIHYNIENIYRVKECPLHMFFILQPK